MQPIYKETLSLRPFELFNRSYTVKLILNEIGPLIIFKVKPFPSPRIPSVLIRYEMEPLTQIAKWLATKTL